MIRLSNGHEFDFQCASGALGFDGLGWLWEKPLRWLGIIDPKQLTVVAKTITTEPKKGNLSWWHPWTCVRPLSHNNTVNAVGLTNPGVKKWVEEYYPRAKDHGLTIAASVESDSWEDAFVLGTFLRECDLAFIEVNVSCPNVGTKSPSSLVSKVVSGLKMADHKHPVIVKLSFQQTQDTALMESVANNPAVEAVHAINTVPWEVVYPGTTSPISPQGGVSGPAIHTLALTAVHNLAKTFPHKPVVGGGGIMNEQGVENFRQVGARAFSLGTVYLHKPWAPKRIIAKCRGCHRG